MVTCEDRSDPDDLGQADDSRHEAGHQDQGRHERPHPQVHFRPHRARWPQTFRPRLFFKPSFFRSSQTMTISTLNKNWLKRDELSETLSSFLFHFILFDNKPLFVPFLPFISSQLQKKSSRDRDRRRSRRSESVDTRANTTMSLSTSTSEWLKGAAAAEQEKEKEEEEEEGKKAKHRRLHEKKMIWYESARKGWNHLSIHLNEWPLLFSSSQFSFYLHHSLSFTFTTLFILSTFAAVALIHSVALPFFLLCLSILFFILSLLRNLQTWTLLKSFSNDLAFCNHNWIILFNLFPKSDSIFVQLNLSMK